MSNNPNKCTTCLETGDEHKDCPKCSSSGFIQKEEKVTVIRECPVHNCSNGLYAPNCSSCRGSGCTKCGNTGMALWDSEKSKSKQPKSGTHVEGFTHFFTKCKVCKGTNQVKRIKRFPNKKVCPVCRGRKRVPTQSGLPCEACGGTSNKKCGVKIELPKELALE